MASEDEATYAPKDLISVATQSTLVMGAAGLAVSAVQNTLKRENVTAWSVFTRGGGNIAHFAAVGGAFGAGSVAAANLRQKDDSWNPAIGGFLAGAVLGITSRRFPVILGWGASLAVAQGVFDYTGGKFSGYDKDPNVDEYERKMALRATTRHPIQETIDTLGEGRGIYGPNYRERRAKLIKETYGIDVPRT